ncbi:MAG: hypothetical protein COB67_10725 [SAR324 cluster bacterium]|uniref:Uncharacterized protein n=1 Tax=SAR324 cluster bacterium TaxID=2024889 RepID=A0A2A4SV74_9DELT|nr:MAG: hypothetical protein COB67_10725 [SAR324 cluster bacterium]
MNRLNASTAFMTAVTLLILALAGATYHFFSEMNSNYVLVQSGISPVRRVMNPYKYTQNKKGLIFSLSFLISGISFTIMVLLPSSEKEAQTRQAILARKAKQPQPAMEPQEAVHEAEGAEETGPSPMEPEEGMEKRDSSKEEMIEELDSLDALEGFAEDSWENITEGEDDVVYGTGPISGAAIMDFVHKFPDSALKFLYRKQLNGKPLTKEEEDIYADWESRNMTRSKIRHYVLNLMEWDQLPRDPLYEIWTRLRDHIFDIIH